MAVRHRRVPIALAAVLVLTGAGVAIAREVPADPPPSWNEAAAPRPSASELPAAGKPATTAKPKKSAAPATEPAVTRARAVRDARTAIRRNGTAIRSAPGEQYRVVDTMVDAAGTRHVRFQRTHQGLAVLGGDFVVHSAATGRFTDATVAQQQAIDVPATAKVDRKQAVAAAERFAGQQGAGNARQVIDAFAGQPVRAWEVAVGTRLVIVDATTGTVRRAYDGVLTAEAGTGHGMLVGDVPLSTTRQADGAYTLVDPDRGGNTVRDGLNEDFVFEPKKFAEFTDADNVWGDGTRADRATTAVDVHYGTAQTMRLGYGAFGNFSVTLTDAPDHMVDSADSFQVTAAGLPAGLTLDVRRPTPGTLVAAIGGIPTTAGSGTTVVTATDADGDQATASVPWQVLPAQPPGAPVSVSVAAGNGTALVEWVRPSYGTGVMVPTGYIVRLSPGQETTLPAAARSLNLTGLDTRRAYTIGVRATSAIGDGAEKTVTLSPTALPLTVTPSAFAYGKSATLTGKILRGSTAIAGTSATLEQRPAGKTAWARITTVKTDAKGAWRATIKPSITTTYRIRYAGSPGAWPATSATPAATVRYTATIKASTTKPKANKKIKLTGTAKPGRAGVKVTLQRKSGSKWVTVTTAKTTSSGSYSFTRSFKRGTWTLRVSVAGGTYNAGATSSGVNLKVK